MGWAEGVKNGRRGSNVHKMIVKCRRDRAGSREQGHTSGRGGKAKREAAEGDETCRGVW